MSDRLDPARERWMTAAATRAVLSALTAEGGAVRFVGGAVRNALIGQPVTDIDIATPLAPETVMRLLATARLQALPTGIEHGTVTAVVDGQMIEVTTLRRDVSTDGRRAVVAFTRDWAQDAARRDFTMNAIYAAPDGTLFDPTDGVGDLRAGRVRFVGDPATRIREDYLRALRLFRFHAWYGKGALDEAALAAAAGARLGLRSLSGERVRKEMLRLLAAPDPVPVLSVMAESGILAEIWPRDAQPDLKRIAGLVAVAHADHLPADPLLRLAALLPDDAEIVRAVARQWKLSNDDRDRLLAAIGETALPADSQQARCRLYREGRQRVTDQVRLFCAQHAGDADGDRARKLLALYESWTPPVFPLGGRDVTALGVPEGPKVGALLGEIEEWWVVRDFHPDRVALLARLQERVKGER